MYLLPTIHGRYIIHGPLAAWKYGNEHTTVSLKIATWLSMYIIRKQLVHVTPERMFQLYEVFQDDMPGDLR